MEGHDASRATWTRLDSLALVGIGLAAGVLRFLRLGSPKELVFDEIYYVPDACRYVVQIPDICGPHEFTFFHPPLGKWLIAFGMQILGPTRYGWRLFPALVGVATIVLLYVLGRHLLRSTAGASVAASALALDPLHFVHSRIAVLDVFLVFFAVAMFTALVLDRDDQRPDALKRPWLALAGVAAGAAVATKWSGILFVIPAIGLAAVWRSRRAAERSKARLAGVALLMVVVPVAVYMLTYAGRFDEPLFTLPWAQGSWIRAFIDRHADMYGYHAALRTDAPLAPHQYSSPAWSWFLLRRPMSYFFRGDVYREIKGMGNPVLWWPAVIALLVVAVGAIKGRNRSVATVILVGFGASYLPWFFYGFGEEDPYLFYVLPALPFLYLALGSCASSLWRHRPWRIAIVVYGMAVIASFAFYFPILTAQPMTRPAWEARMLFRDCEPRFEEVEGDPPLPNRTARHTWCWI